MTEFETRVTQLTFLPKCSPALPEPVAWAAGTECNARGFIDVMAWSEGEFTVPLYTADQLRAYGDARAAALAGVLRLVVGDAEMFCRAAHHSKADRHEAFEPCPIHTRAVAALQEQKS